MALSEDYKFAKDLNLPDPNERWEKGMDHHPMSKRLMAFLADYDLHECGDYFCWKYGGDGDNGETLMFEMDAFFESIEKR